MYLVPASAPERTDKSAPTVSADGALRQPIQGPSKIQKRRKHPAFKKCTARRGIRTRRKKEFKKQTFAKWMNIRKTKGTPYREIKPKDVQ
jgi:uncharacterized protein with NAD-binding domain and iron-sulfur cluster